METKIFVSLSKMQRELYTKFWWRTLTRCACWTFWDSWGSSSTSFTPSMAWSLVCCHYGLPPRGLFCIVEHTEIKLWLDSIVIQQGWLMDNQMEQEEELHRGGGSVPGLHAIQDKVWQGEHVQRAEAGCAFTTSVFTAVHILKKLNDV